MIKIHIQPEVAPMTMKRFAKHSPGYSVALDGYVSEGPGEVLLLPDGPRQNFNHHEGVCRLATLATCQQVLLAIRMGLFETFRDREGRRLNIFANDCDEDVCASTFCLTNPDLVEGTVNPAINRYMSVTGIMDATGGAYPFPIDLPFLEAHTWTLQPYLRFRAQGGLDKRNADDFKLVVEEVCGRILQHVLGNGERTTLDTDYEIIREGSGWCMVKEHGGRARLRMFDDGRRAYVSVAERSDGKIRATVGRFSSYIPFPVPKILEAFNEAEGLKEGDDRAGGSDIVGGTSRKNGTALSIEQLFEITENVMRASRCAA